MTHLGELEKEFEANSISEDGLLLHAEPSNYTDRADDELAEY